VLVKVVPKGLSEILGGATKNRLMIALKNDQVRLLTPSTFSGGIMTAVKAIKLRNCHDEASVN